MFSAAIVNPKDLIEIFISGASVLGGMMALASGHSAARSTRRGASPATLADSINRGLAEGFRFGLPFAGLAIIFLVLG